MSSQLNDAMESLIKVFYSYSVKEGDKYKLSNAELRTLLQEELSDFLAVSNCHIRQIRHVDMSFTLVICSSQATAFLYEPSMSLRNTIDIFVESHDDKQFLKLFYLY